MTGKRPEHDEPLPRPALMPNVPLGFIVDLFFLSVGRHSCLRSGCSGVTLTVVKRPRRWHWEPAEQDPPPLPTPLTVLPRRWVVERVCICPGRYRCVSNDPAHEPSARIMRALQKPSTTSFGEWRRYGTAWDNMSSSVPSGAGHAVHECQYFLAGRR